MTDLEIARYSFVPWLREGVAGGIQTPDDFGAGTGSVVERATVRYDVFLNGNAVHKHVHLVGPGDIIGLDRRAIVRLQPGDRVMDFEPNFLAFVDFYDEDLPWRYTPAAPSGQRLRPWLAVVVLDQGASEYERAAPPDAKLSAITVAEPGRVLPPPDELWAWAHVHVDEDLKPGAGDDDESAHGRLGSLLATVPDRAGSRILCPRRLRPNREYRAFLVPVFETGRRAGLGLDPAGTDGLQAAWGAGAATLPTYFSWRFRTGERGDFEHLVRLLVPRVLDPRVGIRDMDVQEPGFGLPGAGQPTLGLEGALRSPSTESTPWPDRAGFQIALADLVNLPDTIAQAEPTADPTISLPLYARWHALAKRIAESGTPRWVDQLNLDPRTRAATGLGTRVVQTYQERYMDDAWGQIGEVLRANRMLRLAQMSKFAGELLHEKHLRPMTLGNVIQVTRPVHAKILGSPTTLFHQLRHSALPLGAVDPGFRKLLRAGGAIRKRMDPAAARGSDRILERINAGEITTAPPKRAGTGHKAIDRHRQELLPTDWRSVLRRLLAPFLDLLLILLVVLVVLALALFASGLAALAVLALLLAAAGFWLWRGASQQAATERAVALLDEANLTPGAIDAVPPRPTFTIVEAGQDPTEPGRGGTDSPQAARFRAAARGLHGLFTAAVETPAARQPLELATMRGTLLRELQPSRALLKRIRPRLDLAARIPGVDIRPIEKIVPIMAAPDFPYPMYEELERISGELLIPNLGMIERNTISLLETNQPFIESYMVGLNHEMGRELLSREYPCDQRGSYFRQFWDVSDTEVADAGGLTPEQIEEKLRDIPPVHTWSRFSDLGEHNHRLPPGDDRARLVLVIRGDLLNRYPTAVVTAAPAVWPASAGVNDDRDIDFTGEITPLFKARVGEDITFFGFDLTEQDARGSRDPNDGDPGWFFVIRERPGEPRFGLDVAEQSATTTIDDWNDLSWGHVGAPGGFDSLDVIRLADGLHHVAVSSANNPDNVHWNTHAGDLAHILYQVPVLVGVHAYRMLPEE